MDYIYSVVDSGGAFPCAFTTYADALAEVKEKYKESWQKDCGGAEVKNKTYDYWSSHQDDEDVEEGSKLDDEDDGDENVTQIWIDVHVGIVTIYRLKIKR
jgi:hypothetical protein